MQNHDTCMMFLACLTFEAIKNAKCFVASRFLMIPEPKKGLAHLGSFFVPAPGSVAFGHQNFARTPSNSCAKWKGAILFYLILAS